MNKGLIPLALAAAVALTSPQSAHAFCGFYVAGADASLYNNATQVVLMREGTRTILSMQNNYKGPLDDFAMVVPVPVVLQEENVKTLPQEIFAKVDTMTSPRLVEYWERDPCYTYDYYYDDYGYYPAPTATAAEATPSQVTIEAEFTVGEYGVVVLSSTDSTALETWLINQEYSIPPGSAEYLDPYIQSGAYFFVAKIDSTLVNYEDGRVVLSPLRFHYDSVDFSLPIRLGLINSAGAQDLLVYTLGLDQRYNLANYPNATIPTNIEVVNEVRDDFGTFYEALFQRTLDANPGAVVTEYAWNASTCDPCPGPTLDPSDYLTLGADVLPGEPTYGWVISRLHARYTADNIGEDLVFQQAEPIVGGRERYDENGELETGATTSTYNNFQGRYIIRHPWEGPVECEDPRYGYWGGPPEGGSPELTSAQSPNTKGEEPADATSTRLEDLVAQDIPEIGVDADATPTAAPEAETGTPTAADGDDTEDDGGCGCKTARGSAPATLALLGLALVFRRRNRGLNP